jgi:hypothetical protein
MIVCFRSLKLHLLLFLLLLARVRIGGLDSESASSTTVMAFSTSASTHQTKNDASPSSAAFPFVHHSIARILACQKSILVPSTRTVTGRKVGLDCETLRLEWRPESDSDLAAVAAESRDSIRDLDLIPLALQCDEAIFGGTLTERNSNGAHVNINSNVFSDLEQALIHFAVDSDNPGINVSARPKEEDARVTVAILLALNALESAIRDRVGNFPAGRAPLLKDLLAQLAHQDQGKDATGVGVGATVAVLQVLLLPTGLNLRNLLWHGFVGAELPRPWLALVLVLIGNVRNEQEHQNGREQDIDDGMKQATVPVQLPVLSANNPSWDHILTRGEHLRRDIDTTCLSIPAWLPATHVPLWELAVDWMTAQVNPVCTCAILSVLTEHALRLDWCRVNQEPVDCIAQPGRFYVTLDGHGQRFKHDLLLHPYRMAVQEQANCSFGDDEGDDNEENKESRRPNALVAELGGATVALLTDLFAAASGGPNIRACLAHGLWDSYLQDELIAMSRTSRSSMDKGGSSHMVDRAPLLQNSDTHWNMVRALLVAMEQAASPRGTNDALQYRPIFSYTATTAQSIQKARDALLRLAACQESETFTRFQGAAASTADVPAATTELSISLGDLLPHLEAIQTACRRRSAFQANAAEEVTWTATDVFLEHDTNRQLATHGAVRTLLEETAQAALTFAIILEKTLKELQGQDDHSSRKRRRLLRIAASCEFVRNVYGFATFVAVICLQEGLEELSLLHGRSMLTDGELLKATERSRMVVSTVDNFIATNAERSYKAAAVYTKAKVVKKIIANNVCILSDPLLLYNLHPW